MTIPDGTKEEYFIIILDSFLHKTYTVGTHYNCLNEVFLLNTSGYVFVEKLEKLQNTPKHISRAGFKSSKQ